MSTTDKQVTECPSFSADERRSIESAFRQEIAAVKEPVSSSWLHIDAIEQLQNPPGVFVYRLVLSSAAHFDAELPLVFETRRPKDTIQAVVIGSDDDGIVVQCQKPLPTDAKLLNVSFDPTFILRALEQFLGEQLCTGGTATHLVLTKTVPHLQVASSRRHPGLNENQSAAVEEMAAIPLRLLWGPPGTGKTTTIGAAVVNWMRQQKSVLVVSTSNAAVDVAMRAVLKRVRPNEKARLLRLGTSLDPAVQEITPSGRLAAQNTTLGRDALTAQRRHAELKRQISQGNLSPDAPSVLHREMIRCEAQISAFAEQTASAAPEFTICAQVVGCTLAKMVLDRVLRTHSFDAVVVDEASMASVLYAIAASVFAKSHIVYAGDPKQLPPIVQSNSYDAVKWFGHNIFDWFGMEITAEVAATEFSLLRTQYRMTNQIGGVVSRLSYGNLLNHGRNADGPLVEFIEIPEEWQTTHFCVQENSYFHLAAIPILHALGGLFAGDELLLLSPFRPQRSLLAAIAFDLKKGKPGRKITSSTIHRAQGSEAKVVVVDLTTHSPSRIVTFFRDRQCDKLFNVAISRAKDHLIIIGSRPMLLALASRMPFWRRVGEEFGTGIDSISCADLIEDLPHLKDLTDLPTCGSKQHPAIYCQREEHDRNGSGVDALRRIDASRKLLLVPDGVARPTSGDFIVRQSEPGSPPVFVGCGQVCLPIAGTWVAVESPNVARVIWRVGFSHLADEEIDPAQAKRFVCPRCGTGDLVIKWAKNEGMFLACVNGREERCYYRRRVSLEDAKFKVRLQGMRCPRQHPLTARTGPNGLFIGCENYPECDYSEPLSVLEGV